MPRRDHAGDFRIAKFLQQSPNVAVDRFLPNLFTPIEITADQGAVDSRSSIAAALQNANNPPSLTPPPRSEVVVRPGVSQFKLIDRGKNFLDFVANDVTTEFEGLTINKLAVRLSW